MGETATCCIEGSLSCRGTWLGGISCQNRNTIHCPKVGAKDQEKWADSMKPKNRSRSEGRGNHREAVLTRRPDKSYYPRRLAIKSGTRELCDLEVRQLRLEPLGFIHSFIQNICIYWVPFATGTVLGLEIKCLHLHFMREWTSTS